jgi:hypothetical protein
MNPHDDSPLVPSDDPVLQDMLAPLKHLEPPLEARIANRQAVSAALASLPAVNPKRHWPWWRRSISVPVPIAAALVLIMAAALFSNLRSPPAKHSIGAHAAAGTFPKSAPDIRPAAKFYETETYLCGVGRLSSESYSIVKD